MTDHPENHEVGTPRHQNPGIDFAEVRERLKALRDTPEMKAFVYKMLAANIADEDQSQNYREPRCYYSASSDSRTFVHRPSLRT